ncbi:NTP transferase domain-containing protein [bacterium]|nr:NTP transferase domain-containing protein [bacterium]
MKIIGVITARMGSSRLPEKVLKRICGKSIFEHHVERLKMVKGLDEIWLATSKENNNQPLIDESKRLKIPHYAGEKEDVLERHIAIINKTGADAALRITCDCPLFNFELAAEYIKLFQNNKYDYMYCSNMTMLCGTIAELISAKSLIESHKHYKGHAITQYIKENLNFFNTQGVDIPNELCRPDIRLTIDYQEDFDVITRIYKALYKGNPLYLKDVYRFLDDNPEIALINRNVLVTPCNIYGDNLLGRPLYSIVKRGDNYVIIDSRKKIVEYKDFLGKITKLFKINH